MLGSPCTSPSSRSSGSDAFAYGTINPPSEDPMAAVGKQIIAKVDPLDPPRRASGFGFASATLEPPFSTITGERLAS